MRGARPSTVGRTTAHGPLAAPLVLSCLGRSPCPTLAPPGARVKPSLGRMVRRSHGWPVRSFERASSQFWWASLCGGPNLLFSTRIRGDGGTWDALRATRDDECPIPGQGDNGAVVSNNWTGRGTGRGLGNYTIARAARGRVVPKWDVPGLGHFRPGMGQPGP